MRVADFRLQLFVAIVELRAKSGIGVVLADFFRVSVLPFSDGQHDRLHRSQPDGNAPAYSSIRYETIRSIVLIRRDESSPGDARCPSAPM